MIIYHRNLFLSIVTIAIDASFVSSNPGESWASIPNDSFSNEDGDTNMYPRKLEASTDFAPLSCNNNTDPWDCVPWDFGSDTGAIEIPCDKCYSMVEFTNGEYITLSGPLDIKGKLDFPDGTIVTLETTGIIVQGELAMTSTRAVNGNPDITIKLTGSNDIHFTPDPENSEACFNVTGQNESTCNLGVKPFVVAGGKLTINGMPDPCPSWTTVADFETGGAGKPNPTVFSQPPPPPVSSKGTCEATLLEQAFESGLGTWYGNLGAREEIQSGSHDGTQYLRISRRNALFQGPLYDMSADLRECIIPDVNYFFSAKIRLSASDGISSSQCSNIGENCPKIQIGYLDDSDALRWRPLATFQGVNFVDDEWHDVRASFQFDAEHVSVDNVFSALLLNGPEPGIDISIDDIQISLPPALSYPDPSDVCADLIQNGDAGQLNGFAGPMYSFIKSNSIIVKDDGDGNDYFSITNRIAGQDSLALSLTPQCLEEGSIYRFSMRIKIDSTAEVVPRVITKTHTTGTPAFDIVATCPSSSNDIGWVTCESDFVFSAHHTASPEVELLVFLRDDFVSDVHYDDISFTFHCGMVCPMILKDDPVSCWAPGAEVIFTSETLLAGATTTTTLETVGPGGVITTPPSAVDPPPTMAADNPHTAGEIALLSRNILFENGDSSTTGPSLLVLRTPNVNQLIQGVEFNGFGDQAVAGRHAINFEQSGNSTGSIVSKNSIRHSNSRCVNIHATDNVMISDNVAHHTYGHCFALQGANERGNVFRNNIGVETLKAMSSINGAGDDESPATFYIAYPTNTWIGNSAAGSEAYGFWFVFKNPTTEWLSAWLAPLTAFEDNKSHSNSWFGLRVSPFGYNPTVTATLANSKIYKNRGQGIYTHNTGNVVIDGGYFADNAIAIDLIMDNSVAIQNVNIVGYSPEYKRLSSMQPQTTPTFCNTVGGIIGVRLHINEYSLAEGLATLSNITFSDFDKSCNSAVYTVAMNPNKRAENFNTKISMRNLTYVGITDVSSKVNFCSADAAGIFDIILEDVDGSLNPADSGPGFIVSNAVNLIGGNCTVLVDSCARFCTNILPGDASAIANMNTDVAANADAIANANTPGYADANTPASGNNPTSESLSCITNPDFESGTNGWRAVNAGIETVASFNGIGSALKISDRTVSATGSLWQDIRTSCITIDAWYEISADVKMTQKGSSNIFDCNPTILWHNDPKSCAGIMLFRSSQVPPLKEIAFTVGPYDASGWTKLYGTFQATADLLSQQNSIGFLVGRAAITSDITVDNILIGPVTNSSVGVTNCSQPLQNGDAEIGDHRLWWVFGQNDIGSRIELSAGYGNSTYAFKHTGPRDQKNRGMLQKMEGSCFPTSSTWIITAKFKYFEENGNYASCSKNRTSGADTCPSFQMLPEGEYLGNPLINQDETPMVVGEWNDIKSEYNVGANDEFSELHILVTSVNAGFNYELDNIELVATSS